MTAKKLVDVKNSFHVKPIFDEGSWAASEGGHYYLSNADYISLSLSHSLPSLRWLHEFWDPPSFTEERPPLELRVVFPLGALRVAVADSRYGRCIVGTLSLESCYWDVADTPAGAWPRPGSESVCGGRRGS